MLVSLGPHQSAQAHQSPPAPSGCQNLKTSPPTMSLPKRTARTPNDLSNIIRICNIITVVLIDQVQLNELMVASRSIQVQTQKHSPAFRVYERESEVCSRKAKAKVDLSTVLVQFHRVIHAQLSRRTWRTWRGHSAEAALAQVLDRRWPTILSLMTHPTWQTAAPALPPDARSTQEQLHKQNNVLICHNDQLSNWPGIHEDREVS